MTSTVDFTILFFYPCFFTLCGFYIVKSYSAQLTPLFGFFTKSSKLAIGINSLKPTSNGTKKGPATDYNADEIVFHLHGMAFGQTSQLGINASL